MDSTIISAVIATTGVVISVLISLLLNKKQLNNELDKMHLTIHENYTSRLIQKRLEFYPSIYEILSEMGKKLKRVEMKFNDENISFGEIEDFKNHYDLLNSKYALVFGNESSSRSHKLRLYLLDLLNKRAKARDEILSEAQVVKLRNLIALLEFSMKSDLGIYISDFNDTRRELNMNHYGDVTKIRKERNSS
jgi:hypothetical protein